MQGSLREEAPKKLNMLDVLTMVLITNSEKCSKIYNADYDYSSTSKRWIEQGRVRSALICQKRGDKAIWVMLK